MRNIGIIGCAGFIGSHLLEALLIQRECKIIGIDRVQEKIEHLLPNPHLHFKKMDINNWESIYNHFSTCDTIVSLASLCNPALYNTIPLEVIESNFTKPLQLVSYCTETGKKLIHFSTCEVYGKTVYSLENPGTSQIKNRPPYVLSEDTTPLIMGPISAQRWSYAAAKQLLERVIYASGEQTQNPLDYTIIRPFNFIGPRMDFISGIDGEGIPRVIACFMEALLFGKPLKIVDGGLSTRSFTAISDAVNGIVSIIDKPEQSQRQIFNLGNPANEISIRQLAETMINIYQQIVPENNNIPRQIIEISSEEFYGKGYEDSDQRSPDISKAKKLLDWQPRIGLEEALRQTIISFLDYYGKKYAA